MSPPLRASIVERLAAARRLAAKGHAARQPAAMQAWNQAAAAMLVVLIADAELLLDEVDAFSAAPEVAHVRP